MKTKIIVNFLSILIISQFLYLIPLDNVLIDSNKYINKYTIKTENLIKENELSISPEPSWITTGTEIMQQYGMVSQLGDVNGDGYDDIAVGSSPWPSSNLNGRVDIFYGSDLGLHTIPDLTILGNQSMSQFGSAMNVGDINGDGYNDLLVGAITYDNGETDEGKVFLYYGSSNGLSPSPSWSFESNSPDANLGSLNINPSGDLNRDGYNDILISAIGYNNGRGKVYAFYGSRTGLGNAPIWTATGDQENSSFGVASIIGDVNGDGFLDVGVGSRLYDNSQTDEGRIYVYYGTPNGLPSEPNWIADGNSSYMNMGFQIAPAGDVNADGFSDFAVGCYSSETIIFVYYGSNAGGRSSPDWTISPGIWPNAAGDINKDGFDDLYVGDPWSSYASGKGWIYSGSSTGLTTSYIWSDAGETYEEHFGWPASSLGDVNGDGANDLVIGAHAYYGYDIRYGRAFLYYGIPEPKITGFIKNDSNQPISNVSVLLSDGQTTTTNENGFYSFNVLNDFTYNITPLKINYRFAPNFRKITTPVTDLQNFIMRPSVPDPFINLPFIAPIFLGFNEQESFVITVSGNIDKTGNYGKVNSWFDHETPNDFDQFLKRWDWNGILMPDPIDKPCDLGQNCYDGHDGIDFSLATGNEVHAIAEGDIIPEETGWGCLGWHVTINHHNGYFSIYGHLRDEPIDSGHVNQGDIIGISGNSVGSGCISTGPHLHFGVYYDVNGNQVFDSEDKVVDPFGWQPSNVSYDDPWIIESFYLWIYSNKYQCIVSPSGTFQEDPSGFLSIQIPPGAVSEDKLLQILDSPPPSSPLPGHLFTGVNSNIQLFDLRTDYFFTAQEKEPQLSSFLYPVSFSVKYFPNQLSHINSDLLALYRFDELSNSWITLESTIDPIAGTVTASTTELGYFSLQAPLICQDSLYEPNDLYDGAILINYGQGSITESFDTYQDEDWFRIDGFNGINYIIKTLDLAEGVDTILTVYNSDGITIINSDDNSGGGFSSLLSFTADQNDTYFIRVSKSSISSFGCNSSYKLDIKNDSKLIFIPLIYK